MREIYKSLNKVEISYITAMLRERGIEVLIQDQNMSSLYGDNGLFPSRLMVINEDYFQAMAILKDLDLDFEINNVE